MCAVDTQRLQDARRQPLGCFLLIGEAQWLLTEGRSANHMHGVQRPPSVWPGRLVRSGLQGGCTPLQRTTRRRDCEHGIGSYILGQAVRHGHRSVRHQLDDLLRRTRARLKLPYPDILRARKMRSGRLPVLHCGMVMRKRRPTCCHRKQWPSDP